VPLPRPELGLVIRYAYLWHSEYKQGREEGEKDRPCAIILAFHDNDDEMIVSVLPVTHVEPRRAEDGVEIPLETKRRLGLDEARSWVIVTELNRFVWPGPDLRSVSRTDDKGFDYGFLPPRLYRTVRERFFVAAKAQRIRLVPRSE
jgi:hypothetical protein